MALYLAVLGGICVLVAAAWLLTGLPALGWALLGTILVGLALLVLRVVFQRGAPDDKFPWE